MYLVERDAIIIRPKKPLLDWINSIEKINITLKELRSDADLFLLPKAETKESLQRKIKENYDYFFENQLFEWYTDSELWPKNRSYKMFCEWFDIEIYKCVFDTVEEYIEKELY